MREEEEEEEKEEEKEGGRKDGREILNKHELLKHQGELK